MMPRGAADGAQDRGEHMTAVNGTPQVDSQRPLPIVQWRITDGRAAGADTGVVDHQCGWGAEPGLRLLGQRLHVPELRDITKDCEGFRAVFGDRVGRPLGGGLVDIAVHDGAAALAQFEGEGRTDAASGAGHHRQGAAAGLRSVQQPVQHVSASPG